MFVYNALQNSNHTVLRKETRAVSTLNAAITFASLGCFNSFNLDDLNSIFRNMAEYTFGAFQNVIFRSGAFKPLVRNFIIEISKLEFHFSPTTKLANSRGRQQGHKRSDIQQVDNAVLVDIRFRLEPARSEDCDKRSNVEQVDDSVKIDIAV